MYEGRGAWVAVKGANGLHYLDPIMVTAIAVFPRGGTLDLVLAAGSSPLLAVAVRVVAVRVVAVRVVAVRVIAGSA